LPETPLLSNAIVQAVAEPVKRSSIINLNAKEMTKA